MTDSTDYKCSVVRQGIFCFEGSIRMGVSYKKLWKLLIDKDMKKKDLYIAAEVSPATITKMGRGGHVSTSVIMRICMALNCQPEDIMEITEIPPTGC